MRDGGEPPGAEKGRGPGAEEARVSGGGGDGGVELADFFLVACEEEARTDMGHAQGFDIVVAGEKDAALRMVLGEFRQAAGDRAEGGLALPLRVDGVRIVAEEAERRALAGRSRDGAVEEAEVLMDVGND